MRIFVLRYDRKRGVLVEKYSFGESERDQAQAKRLSLELEVAASGADQEVVLLEGENEDALRESHARYFKSLDSIKEALKAAS